VDHLLPLSVLRRYCSRCDPRLRSDDFARHRRKEVRAAVTRPRSNSPVRFFARPVAPPPVSLPVRGSDTVEILSSSQHRGEANMPALKIFQGGMWPPACGGDCQTLQKGPGRDLGHATTQMSLITSLTNNPTIKLGNELDRTAKS